jgi:hypothetical protein
MNVLISTISLIKIYEKLSMKDLEKFSIFTGCSNFELVPGYIFGANWDSNLLNNEMEILNAIQDLPNSIKFKSMQSITYGIDISLFDNLLENINFKNRVLALVKLTNELNINNLVLGSPAQKKNNPKVSPEMYKINFEKNINFISRSLPDFCSLSLEHNTIKQGAEAINTLSTIKSVIINSNLSNVGINIDTQCLEDEFGSNFIFSNILNDYVIAERITSIQLCANIFNPNNRSNLIEIFNFAKTRDIAISLEFIGEMNSENLKDKFELCNNYCY